VIDQFFPWAKDFRLGDSTIIQARDAHRFAAITRLPGLVEILDQIPDELLVMAQDEAAEFAMAHAALLQEARILATGGRNDVQWPMLGSRLYTNRSDRALQVSGRSPFQFGRRVEVSEKCQPGNDSSNRSRLGGKSLGQWRVESSDGYRRFHN